MRRKKPSVLELMGHLVERVQYLRDEADRQIYGPIRPLPPAVRLVHSQCEARQQEPRVRPVLFIVGRDPAI